MLLKFNNIRDLSDARYAAAAMAEWIGFSVGKEDSLSVGKIQEIIGWCAGPKIVLEMDADSDATLLQSYLSVLPVDAIETTQQGKDIFSNIAAHLDFIVLGNPQSNILTHNAEFSPNEHITNVTQWLQKPNWVIEKNPWAISVDCVNSPDPALKSYDEMSDFFEVLGIF